MKARLLPIYFKNSCNKEFKTQVDTLRGLLADEAEILDAVEIGSKISGADAVIFPVLIGEAYKQLEKIKNIDIPIVALTSEFGTVAMWDWEIITFLKSYGVEMFAPYDIQLTKVLCRALAVKKGLKNTKFLVYQDKPGEAGMQPEIFKRFYWWEETCTKLMERKFGIKIVKKSFAKLAGEAADVSDKDAAAASAAWELNQEGVSERALISAAKMYVALKREIEKEGNVGGVGINCLNESACTNTTPCLAYNMLFEEDGVLWVCEGDTMSLLTKYIVYKSLKAPIIMSNMYPFLMGMAALKHEKIQSFPDIEEPDNCILVAHCGYFGMVPRCFACEWTLRPRALAIVDENALAVDARLPVGDITITKLHSNFEKIQSIEGKLEQYVQYPGSDCRNGGIIRVKNGRKLMNSLYSHHMLIVTGKRNAEIELVAKVFGLDAEID